jgi:PPE-repeat protein
LGAVAAQAQGAAGQVRAVASAFETALMGTVHPTEVAVNRNRLVSLVMSNLFGQNAPAIAETECNCERMWAQDVGALFGYHAEASTAAAALAPWQGPLSAVSKAAAGLAIPLPGNNGNLGLGNTGLGNTGFGNNGNANVGVGNSGSSNFGIGNSGNSNIGIGLSGNSQFGIGKLNTGTGNIGLFNSGTGNRGLFNSGNGITGIFNMSLLG